MAEDLGGRLTRAGLVTRADLAEIVSAAPAHDAALVRALVRRGVPEDALAGFFLSEGFGPLLEAVDLDRAEPVWATRLPGVMALDFLALPLRAATDGVVVAMAAPSDAHIVRELVRVLGARVLATVARPSDIEGRLRALHPHAMAVAPRTPAAEPPVLELTRRRQPTSPRGFDAGFRAPDGTKEGKLGPRLALPDDEPAMPLVRHKPSITPPVGVSRSDPSITVPNIATPNIATPASSAATKDAAMRTFARPDPRTRATTGDWARGREAKRSNTQPLAAAVLSGPKSSASIVATAKPAVISVPPAAVPAQPPAATLEGALTDFADRASEPVRAAERAVTPASGASAMRKTATWRPSAPAPARAEVAPPTVAPPPAPMAPLAPVPVSAEERWDLPSAPPDAPAPPARESANKLSPRATNDLPSIKAAPGDIGAVLASMRTATDRDDVVRLACEGATSVARTAVFFALRKGVLKGWDGAGPGVRRDSVRNLWIPTSSTSTFKKVLDTKSGCVGPYGTSVADGLFRAAVGSRGGDFMVQPIAVAGKIIGMLCVDDLRPGPLGAHRVEVLAQTVGDAFVRIISAGKD